MVGDPIRILTWQPAAIEGLHRLCQDFAGQCYTETYYYPPDEKAHSLGIFPPHTDKGTALTLVLEKLGLSWDNVMAIGDNFNDLPMFERAGLSVAMGNAPAKVKEKAMVIAPSNDEEGVAWAVQRY